MEEKSIKWNKYECCGAKVSALLPTITREKEGSE